MSLHISVVLFCRLSILHDPSGPCAVPNEFLSVGSHQLKCFSLPPKVMISKFWEHVSPVFFRLQELIVFVQFVSLIHTVGLFLDEANHVDVLFEALNKDLLQSSVAGVTTKKH